MVSTHVANLSRHSGRYLATLRWLLADAVRRNPGRSALVLAGSFLGALSHGAIFGLLVAYARALEADSPLSLGSMTIQPRDERTFFMMGAITLALLLGSALVIYFSRRQVVALVVRHYRHCSQQVLRLYGARPDARLRPANFRQVLRALKKRSNIDAKLCGKSLRILLGAIVPLLTVIWTSAVMFWIDAWATLGVLALVAVFLVLYYFVNRRVVLNQRRLEASKPQARADWLDHVQKTRSHARWSPRHEQQTQRLYDTGEMRVSLEAYGQRLLATVHAEFVGNVLLALGIAGVLIYLGAQAIGQEIGWSEFFAFLITARIGISSVRSVFTSLTGFSKLYPFVRRYYDFVLSAPREDSAVEPVSHLQFIAPDEPQFEGLQRCDARPGDRIALLSPVEINRYTVFYFADCLTAGSDVPSERIVGSIYFVHSDQVAVGQVSVREFAHLPAGWSIADLDARFNGVELGRRLTASGFNDLEKVHRRREFKSMGESLRHELLLASAATSLASVVIIDHEVLAQIEPDARRRWLEALGDRIVLVHCGEEPARVGLAGESAVCVATAAGVAALGSPAWLHQHEQDIRAFIASTREADSAADVADDVDDEEELLDDEV